MTQLDLNETIEQHLILLPSAACEGKLAVESLERSQCLLRHRVLNYLERYAAVLLFAAYALLAMRAANNGDAPPVRGRRTVTVVACSKSAGSTISRCSRVLTVRIQAADVPKAV